MNNMYKDQVPSKSSAIRLGGSGEKQMEGAGVGAQTIELIFAIRKVTPSSQACPLLPLVRPFPLPPSPPPFLFTLPYISLFPPFSSDRNSSRPLSIPPPRFG
ncbi:unnamed protein product [Aspergillus oryzae RIB40]|uniref:DNA, SC038 n=2 Tax=Aspergillus oryzae TaxID=5062 RepID=Q2U308_ASPOR|nr:unnamed protein product [Aspergillus oryzae RIB40]EIT74645.1 hypothetical protein Ao3042_09400 [Aspergillus oryzae 3.042]KDE77293.1 hypothetical protein AO1008_03261 [Aspergillus oryzae 100-8]BAE64057.1 unnamed protein product [Aspergillus oryzae RIB40]|eukprot:EIT74645.1 hypothetical protein Ao3042_09400 [Aspergillus oryzae 3.042]